MAIVLRPVLLQHGMSAACAIIPHMPVFALSGACLAAQAREMLRPAMAVNQAAGGIPSRRPPPAGCL